MDCTRPSSSRAIRLSELSFETLPASGSEAVQIAALWDWYSLGKKNDTEKDGTETILLTGSDATEEAFERFARGRAALHLATTGFFLPSAGHVERRPGAGRLAGIPRATPRGPGSRARAGPLAALGSGFAGANLHAASGAGGDGLLLAEEICALDLSGVRLAVLSACDTGVGQVRNGEGVFGLRRAFQLAGVRTLVTSLWPVQDETTEKRMLEFYRHWLLEGDSAAEALQSAARHLLRIRRERGESTHPYHWAGFVAVGGRT